MAIRGPDVVLTERISDGHILIVRVNRPERANAHNVDVFRRLAETWEEAKKDDDVWAIVLTSVGDKYWGAGEDLKDRAELDATYPGGFVKYVQDMGGIADDDPAGHGLWKPIIGAINGYCLAGAWRRAQYCDVRIAAEHALFGVPEVRWNLPAGFMWRAARMMPFAMAMEMTLWGARQYPAQRMYEVGFVNKVVPGDQLLDEAIRWAEEVIEMGPASVWAHKEVIYRSIFNDSFMNDGFARKAFDKVQDMEDAIEGPRAFAEKRKPQWKLR